MLLTALAAGSPGEARETHPFSVRDMVAMERLSDPRISPDGRWVVFSRRSWDETANKVTTNLWLVSTDGAVLRQLTAARQAVDSSPSWSPDSRWVAFVSNRGGASRIWAIALAGGEAEQLSSVPVDVDNVQWSPDGSRLAFTAEVYPDCADLQCTTKRDEEREKDPVKAREFDSLMIRHWDSWFEGKRVHIFTIPLKAGPAPEPGGDPVDLLKGLDHDAPPRPFGGVDEYAWSPDGREIAFTSNMTEGSAWNTNTDVWSVAADGGRPVCLSESNDATDTQPVYSPDGSTIAWLAMKRPGYEADRQRIVLHNRKTKAQRVLTDGWDRSVGSITFAADGKSLIVTANDTARQPIFSVDVASGKVTKIVAERYNASVSVARSATGRTVGQIAFAQDSLTAPAEIFTARPDGSDVKRVTGINDARVASARMSKPEEFWFKGANGDDVHGWLLRPVDFTPGTKYPLAYLVHGGPQGSWEDHFHYRWNPQAYAGAGYVVATVDFHGSTGYGQAFTDAIRGDWGGKPYEDLMKGIDHILEKYPFIDAGRMGALGASYGGFMINWMAGQTDRFKCFVSHDGVFDTRSNFYTTEELWFPEWEFLGTPWENQQTYERWSPSRFVQNWKTPMLVIHGAKDFRLPETEGFAVFTTLQRRGIPSKLLYFPDENHWVLKAKNSILWHETILAWLDKWLK
jgi:dipeptidyl aminopeptidase/acylaminoacyl peptidase